MQCLSSSNIRSKSVGELACRDFWMKNADKLEHTSTYIVRIIYMIIMTPSLTQRSKGWNNGSCTGGGEPFEKREREKQFPTKHLFTANVKKSFDKNKESVFVLLQFGNVRSGWEALQKVNESRRASEPK